MSKTILVHEGKTLETEIERLNECVHQRRDGAQSQEQGLELVRTRRTDVELEHENRSSIYGSIQEYAGIDRPEWLDC